MKAYHGTNKEFKSLDVNKTSEYGLYFTDEKCFAKAYGSNIHQVELNFNNLLDLTTKEGIAKAIEIFPITLKTIIEDQDRDEDMTVEELLEDEFEACLSCLSNSSVNIEFDICLRDELLKKLKKAGYDCVKLEDYTDGDEHNAYIVFNNETFKKD